MGIPTTKASTANVDSGNDLIANARPDIKQNIDNVNEIIDHLTDSVTQKIAVIAGTGTMELVSGTTYRKAITISYDTDSLIGSVGTYTWSLPAGTYHISCHDVPVGGGNQYQADILLYNESDSSTLVDVNEIEIATTNTNFYHASAVVILGSTKTISYRATGTNIDSVNPVITIHKFQ